MNNFQTLSEFWSNMFILREVREPVIVGRQSVGQKSYNLGKLAKY